VVTYREDVVKNQTGMLQLKSKDLPNSMVMVTGKITMIELLKYITSTERYIRYHHWCLIKQRLYKLNHGLKIWKHENKAKQV